MGKAGQAPHSLNYGKIGYPPENMIQCLQPDTAQMVNHAGDAWPGQKALEVVNEKIKFPQYVSNGSTTETADLSKENETALAFQTRSSQVKFQKTSTGLSAN